METCVCAELFRAWHAAHLPRSACCGSACITGGAALIGALSALAMGMPVAWPGVTAGGQLRSAAWW
jgi:hypothetical protein